jgi:hypothetical protein
VPEQRDTLSVVTSGSHRLPPVPWYVAMGMQEKAQGKRMDGHFASIVPLPLQKDPVGP